MNVKPVDVVFHIGLERTGTTSVQKICTQQAERLRAHGILYPTASLAFRKFNHSPLVAAYLSPTRPDDLYLPHCPARPDDLLQSLFAEIDESGAHTVILSSEYFSSRFGLDEMRRLARDFEGYSPRILLVLRDHQTRLISSYSTHVVSGSHLTLDEYADIMLQPQSTQLRYERIVEDWSAAFGAERVTLLEYSEDDDMVNRVFAAMRAPLRQPASGKRFRYNRSLDAVGTEALRLINKQLIQSQVVSNGTYPMASTHRLILKWGARGRHMASTAWTLNGRNRGRLAEIMRSDTQWLAEHRGLTTNALARIGGLDVDLKAVVARDAKARKLAARMGWLWKPCVALARLRQRLEAQPEGQRRAKGDRLRIGPPQSAALTVRQPPR